MCRDYYCYYDYHRNLIYTTIVFKKPISGICPIHLFSFSFSLILCRLFVVGVLRLLKAQV